VFLLSEPTSSRSRTLFQAVIILYLLVFLTSAASAEVYKWEDANGPHYTDSPGSVPEKYREKVYAETREQIRSTTPQVRPGISKLNVQSVVNQINQASVHQANLEQQRRASEILRQQQARSLAASNKKLEGVFAAFAGFMFLWLLFGFILLIAWISTIVDIVRSEFTTPSNKTVWLLLVLFFAPLGMLLYYIVGLGQKCNSTGYKDKQQEELLARLNPRDSKDKDFVI
jgi:Phospholipase_D-nuclease N-terminal/Domain of unknown function (DUF4124)